jgi:undecaprenyl-diphosphatase
MSVLQAIILGLVQGTTEFAPVSSSGHLILVPWLVGGSWATILNDPALNKTFDVALHMGTLVGAVIYFRHDLARYIAAWFRSVAHREIANPDQRIAWALVIGTIPGAIAGAAFESVIEDKLGQPFIIATMLALFGVVLWAVDRYARSDRAIADITVKDGGLMGLAQALALQPGVSRSGVTITAGRLLGIDRESAARFSFLLSLPIIAGAGLLKTTGVIKNGLPPGFAAPFFWGFVAAGVSGYLVIWGLLAYLRKRGFAVFMWYRIAVALLVFGLIITGVRPATV